MPPPASAATGVVRRRFWEARVEEAWRRRSVLWLVGVRRVGKTVLCQSLADVRYYDCELPRVRRRLEDPQDFPEGERGRRVVLDEIHRLPDPAGVLKIAADHFPDTRVLATGSSTLGASARFRDTLTGRKEEVWLTPMVRADLEDFGRPDLHRRLLRGGLPPFFLSDDLPEREFQEWVDAYWAKDVLELFRLERRHSFQRLLELLMAQSGGLFEATPFARACEVSRTTIANYVAVLEATFVVHVVRPFSAGGMAEIVAAPKVYGLDTGFVCYHRPDDPSGESDVPEEAGDVVGHLGEVPGGDQNPQNDEQRSADQLDRARVPLDPAQYSPTRIHGDGHREEGRPESEGIRPEEHEPLGRRLLRAGVGQDPGEDRADTGSPAEGKGHPQHESAGEAGPATRGSEAELPVQERELKEPHGVKPEDDDDDSGDPLDERKPRKEKLPHQGRGGAEEDEDHREACAKAERRHRGPGESAPLILYPFPFAQRHPGDEGDVARNQRQDARGEKGERPRREGRQDPQPLRHRR